MLAFGFNFILNTLNNLLNIKDWAGSRENMTPDALSGVSTAYLSCLLNLANSTPVHHSCKRLKHKKVECSLKLETILCNAHSIYRKASSNVPRPSTLVGVSAVFWWLSWKLLFYYSPCRLFLIPYFHVS